MNLLRFLLFPITLIYILITSFRNWLFNVKIKRSLKFSLPIINVGNLSMGGTGKTPQVEYLIKLFKSTNQLVTLSRGYGRKVYGFQISNENSSAITIGDEPQQFYNKFNNEINVAVDADRVNGVSEICLKLPKTDLIILDDAFQHRAIQPGLHILLTDYNKPFFNDFVIPTGNLRELRSGYKRADIVVVTKSPDFKSIDEIYWQNKIKLSSKQHLFFSKIIYKDIITFNDNVPIQINNCEIILVTGIANPYPFKEYIEKGNRIIKHFNFPDHYLFKEKDIVEIHNLLTKFASREVKILTTEKDAMRLLSSKFDNRLIGMPWCYQSIAIELNNEKDFNRLVRNYVQENSRDY